jgi:hypothetical protein
MCACVFVCEWVPVCVCTLHFSSPGSIRQQVAERPMNGTSLRKLKHPDYLTVSQANNISRYRFKRTVVTIRTTCFNTRKLCILSVFKCLVSILTIYTDYFSQLYQPTSLCIQEMRLCALFMLQIFRFPSTPSMGTHSDGPLPIHIQLKRAILELSQLQGVQLKSGPYFNISNLFTTCYITQIT